MSVARHTKPQSQRAKAKSVAGHKTPRRKRLTVTRAARELGVGRVHLSKVLHGHRVSHSLTRRYRELVEAFKVAAN